ncbi:Amino-acid acetyltransferase [Kingella potus]|uniref:Amino-acid acetyltransferase n=1 Tax=Kingella potus TaxID=265175 RepID=A0A377R204_9NEIS|nr:amino-acid N-acetyltransferase [Kingella potus]STR02787.1 Amino-acid acetyltransferase [Kingella potus]
MNAADFSAFARSFREAAPYIDQLRGKTLVVGISSCLLESERFRPIAADLALLAGLGIRLVLVYGSRSQINAACEAAGIEIRCHCNRRITSEAVLGIAKQVCGRLSADIAAALTVGLPHAPRRRRLRIASGNFVSARPAGIIDGIDMGYTGCVRKTDTEAVAAALDSGALVLIGPLASSLGGKTFNLSMADTAAALAVGLAAEKLVFLIEEEGILDGNGRRLSNLSAQEAEGRLNSGGITARQHSLLHTALEAVAQGVPRCQILSGLSDGALIGELFTHSGTGTSVAQDPFAAIRPAAEGDIPALIALIRPLEKAGILLHRSREYLESHIGSFFVLEYDRQIYGCAALKTFAEAPQSGELACLAVSPDAQHGGLGEMLLERLAAEARRRGLQQLFALTTQTGEWFAERSFQTASPEDLPATRQEIYRQSGRQSAVFVRHL